MFFKRTEKSGTFWTEKNAVPNPGSRSLICLERSEWIAHSRSFDLSEMSEWANEWWANERWANERIPITDTDIMNKLKFNDFFLNLKTNNNFLSLQNHTTFHSEKRLIKFVRGRECFVYSTVSTYIISLWGDLTKYLVVSKIAIFILVSHFRIVSAVCTVQHTGETKKCS